MIRSRNGESVMDYTLYISNDNSDGTPSVEVQTSSDTSTNSNLQSPVDQEKTPDHQQSIEIIDTQPQPSQSPQELQLSQQDPNTNQANSDLNQRVLLLQHNQQLRQQIRLQTESLAVSVQNTNYAAPRFSAHLLQGRYLMMNLIEGSTFYKCIDISTKEHLVCKIVNNPSTEILTAHFRLEGKSSHVNLLKKVIQTTKQSYLFYEPSRGDLHNYVRVRRYLRDNEAKSLFRQMCEVVKSCHEEGVVLRDLKLRKFVFSDVRRTHLKLETMEDAVTFDDPSDDILTEKRGCPAYVSPEILNPNSTFSGKSADMWSMGVILFTMLVGRYPFNESDHGLLFAKIAQGLYHVPDYLPMKAQCLIKALLQKDPKQRITSEDVLLHPWFKQKNPGTEDLYEEPSNEEDTSQFDQQVPEWIPTTSDGDFNLNPSDTNRLCKKLFA